jgi:hypothetical protein
MICFFAPPEVFILDITAQFCYTVAMRIRSRSGQTMVEYVLALCALLAVIGAMWYLVSAARESVYRTEDLVGSDYP